MRKIARIPRGIWLAWIALVYAAVLEGRGAAAALGLPGCVYALPSLPDFAVAWPVIIGSAIALFRRRLIARPLVGMALVMMVYKSVSHLDVIGMVAAPAGFLGLLACRRWFDEKITKCW